MRDNAARLARLKREFAAFLKEIYPGREKVAVFGEGNAYARVMLVGEAPGQQETLAQRPFVGKAGKNLDEFLDLAGMQREQLYITNVVKFRPVKVHPVSYTHLSSAYRFARSATEGIRLPRQGVNTLLPISERVYSSTPSQRIPAISSGSSKSDSHRGRSPSKPA